MGGINTGKMLAGGIVAGLVINLGEMVGNFVLFVEQNAAIMETLGLAEPAGVAIAARGPYSWMRMVRSMKKPLLQ